MFSIVTKITIILILISQGVLSWYCSIDGDIRFNVPECPGLMGSDPFYLNGVKTTHGWVLEPSIILEEQQVESSTADKALIICEFDSDRDNNCELNLLKDPSLMTWPNGDLKKYCLDSSNNSIDDQHDLIRKTYESKGRNCTTDNLCYYVSDKDSCPSSSCWCSYQGIVESTKIVLEDGHYLVISQVQLTAYHYQPQVNEKRQSEYIDVSFNGSHIIVNGVSSPKLMTLSKPPNVLDKIITEPEEAIKIPDVFFITSGSLLVTIMLSETSSLHQQFQLKAKSACEFHECYLCVESIRTWTCLPTIYKVSYVGFWIILSVVLLFLIPPLWWVTKTICYYILLTPFRVVFNVFKRFKSSARRQKGKEKSDEFDEEIAERRKPMKKKKVSKVTNYNYFDNDYRPMLLILIFLPIVLSCQDFGSIPVSYETCTTDQEVDTCQIRFTVEVSLLYPGHEACFKLTPKIENFKNLHVVLRYNSSTVRIMPGVGYSTSSWKGYYASKHKCWNVGDCKASRCDTMTKEKDKTMRGNLNHVNVTNYPGETECERRCGCATCGCFYCDDGCVFSGYGLVPEGDVFNVYSLLPSLSTLIVDYEIKLSDEILKSGQIKAGQTVVTSDNFKILVESNFIKESYVIPTSINSMVVNDRTRELYLAFASIINNPVAGIIGDIQAVSPLQLNSRTPNSFIYDKSVVVNKNIQDTWTNYEFKSAGINALQNAPTIKIPGVMGGISWYTTDTNVEGRNPHPSEVKLAFSTISDFSFTKEIEKVCPSLELVDASGCYDCNEGSVIHLRGRSTCASGLASLSIDDPSITLSTQFCMLKLQVDIISVYLFTSKASNSFNITISADTSQVIRVEFEAISGSDIRNDTDYYANGTHSSSGGIGDIFDSIGNWVEDLFKGAANWWDYVVIIGIVIGIIVLLIVLAPFLLPFLQEAVSGLILTLKSIASGLRRKRKVQ